MSNFGQTTNPPNTGFGFGSGGEGDSSTAGSACTCMSILTCTGFIEISYTDGGWWKSDTGNITGVDGGLSAGPDLPKDLDTLLYPGGADLKVEQFSLCTNSDYGAPPGGEVSLPVTPPGGDPRFDALTYPPCWPNFDPGCKVKYRMDSASRRGKNTSWLEIGFSQAKNMGTCSDCIKKGDTTSKDLPVNISGPAEGLMAQLEALIEAALPHKACE